MHVLGIDDTDSRSRGMCTTWIGTEIVRRLPTGVVETSYLVRLWPAVEHKTRGNGAVALVADVGPRRLLETAGEVLDEYAVEEDPETNPGAAVVSVGNAKRDRLVSFARGAVRARRTREEARQALTDAGAEYIGHGNGRGLIGATAALGAVGGRRIRRQRAFSDWTYERIVYRDSHRWGTDREVAVPAGLPSGPAVWDTRDPVTGEEVCVPHSPCPVLFGVRGDDPRAVGRAVELISSEPVERTHEFLTNQGTDAHLRSGEIGSLEEGHAYRLKGTVRTNPVSREGGHVHVDVAADRGTCTCVAFSPTGRFRHHVRALREGDEIIACGEFEQGSVKLEKFAVVERSLTRRANPTCPTCERSMESAGQGQGYRCRSCGTTGPSKVRRLEARDIDLGWYEVPPGARRHLAKPLIRGGQWLPVHPTSGV